VKVLVVDDESDALEFLCAALKSQGYECVRASHAEEALLLAQMAPVGLAIIDYMMPGINGDELAKRLRERPQTARIPLILCSGTDARRGDAGPFDRCIPKPVDIDELLGVVRELT
jgi:CheY-like chemotaxis protein